MSCGVGHLGFLIDINNFPLLSPFNDYSCIEFLVSYKKNSFISPHRSMLNLTCSGGHLGYPLDTKNIFKGPSNNYSHTGFLIFKFLVSENKIIYPFLKTLSCDGNTSWISGLDFSKKNLSLYLSFCSDSKKYLS